MTTQTEVNEQVEKLKTGTTTIALLCSDGVVLAADKRATMGNLVANKEAEKVHKIQEHLGMTIAGSVGDAQALIRIMRVQTSLYEIQRGRKSSVEAAGTLLANILQNTKYFPYYIGLNFGGYDSKPRLFSLDALGALMEEKATSDGSGSPVAFGILEDYYKEGKSIKDNLPIAVRALKAAQARDTYSGNGYTVTFIDKKGFHKLTDKEVEDILKTFN